MTKRRPAISVILPVYNAGIYLQQAIESILNQTFEDFELIIINDGSTDKSLETINEFIDSRIVIINQQNQGLAKTLNIGISAAKGDFIARMDQDDISLKNRFETQFSFFIKNPMLSVISGAVEYIDENGITIGRSFPVTTTFGVKKSLLNFGCVICHPAVMMRTKDLTAVGGYSESVGGRFTDYHLWIKFLRNGYHLQNQSKIILQYRILASSMSSEFSMTNEAWRILKRTLFDNNPKSSDIIIINNLIKIESSGSTIRKKGLGFGTTSFYLNSPKTFKKLIDVFYIILKNFLIILKPTK
jgi:glycosyltransferase involved in cell wall biosynthesis